MVIDYCSCLWQALLTHSPWTVYTVTKSLVFRVNKCNLGIYCQIFCRQWANFVATLLDLVLMATLVIGRGGPDTLHWYSTNFSHFLHFALILYLHQPRIQFILTLYLLHFIFCSDMNYGILNLNLLILHWYCTYFNHF